MAGDPDRSARVDALFTAVVDLSPEERAARLAMLGADDAWLVRAVQELLQHHDDPSPVLRALTTPPPGTAPDLAAHTTIGTYEISGVLGRGGMGIVYRAVQKRPRRTVALKLLSPASVDVESVQRFEREIEVLGLLEHPGICRIHEAGSVDLGLGLGEVLYFSMELVEGLPLTQFVQRERVDVRGRCALVAQIADAVQHAHERGVIHRDLKPTNVLVVGGHGEPAQTKVLDFGIARTVGADLPAASTRTRTGSLLGTLQYMSPEQLGGEPHGVDARTDVYALGVILYELLAGQPPLPLQAASLTEACRIVADREPVALGRLDPGLRGDLEVIAAKALAKEREDRYRSAADLAADLNRHLRGEPIVARRPLALDHLRRFARRHRTLVGGVLATMLALSAGLVAVALLARSNRTLADQEAGARRLAEASSERLRGALYAAQMRLCSVAFTVPGGVARARSVLGQWQPEPTAEAPRDLRGFEWFLLAALCQQAALVRPCEATPFDLTWLARDDLLFSSHWHCGVLTRARTGEVVERFDAGVEPLAHSVLADDASLLVQSVTPTRLVGMDPRTRAPLVQFDHAAEILRCALSPDGRLLATNAADGSIVIWETRRGERIATLSGAHSAPFAFSRDGASFAACAEPGRVHVWRTGSWGAPHRDLRGPADVLLDLDFDADGGAIATGGHAGWLRVFDVDRGEQTAAIAHQDGLRRVAFAPSGARVAVACADYAAYVHDLEARTQRQLSGHGGIVAALAWSPDGHRLATMSDDRTLRIWDTNAPPRVHVFAVAPLDNPHDGQILWGEQPGAVFVRSGARMGSVLRLDGPATASGSNSSVSDFRAPIAGGTYSVRLAARDVLSVWTRDGAAEAAVAPLPVVGWQSIAPCAAAPAIAVGARGIVRVWRLGDRTSLLTIPILDVCRGLAWRADGALAVVDGSDVVRVLDATTGAPIASRSFPEGALELACAPAGDAVAVACVDQVIRVWSPERGIVATLAGHSSHVLAVAYSPDGSRLASGGQDRTVKIWDAADGSELLSLPHDQQVCAVAWSPDGRRLASLDTGGCVKVWDARAGYGRDGELR